METNFSYKSFDKKKDKEIDLMSQPDLLQQARQYYLTMTGPQISNRSSSNAKTPQPVRPQQIQKSVDPQTQDQQHVAEILTTNSQTEEQFNEANSNSFEDQKALQSRPGSGRRLRSQRVRGKTPTAVQKHFVTNMDQNKEQNNMKNILTGIQTMDDFANMLLAKHESNRQQQQVVPSILHQSYQQNEIRSNNLFTKVSSYQVKVNDEEQSLPEIVSQVQMLDNSTLPLDDSEFLSSPQRRQIQPYTKSSPLKQHTEQVSLEFAVQKVQITENVSRTDQALSIVEQEEQEMKTHETIFVEKQIVKTSNKYGYLTSIKEFNESQENIITDQTSSPSRQVEFSSLRCDDLGQIDQIERQDIQGSKFQTEQQLRVDINAAKFQGLDAVDESAQCEDNFGSQSPIKQFRMEEDQMVRNNSPKTQFEDDSPDKEIDPELNQTKQELTQQSSEQIQRESNQQYLLDQIEQLKTQLFQARSSISSLEHQLASKDIQKMQDKLNYEQLSQKFDIQKTQHELHVTQLLENNTQSNHKLHHDFEVKKQQMNEEHEKVTAYYKAALQQSQEQLKNYEQTFKQREQLSLKLRQDNQNMFADLKQLAQSEQHLKFELQDAKTTIQELEAHNQQLTDTLRQHNQQFTDQQKSLQAQVEIIKQQTNKSLKDAILDSEKQLKESQIREQQMMSEIQGLLEQNQLLANKAQSLEQERLNITTERERKNNELRQMHNELQKMTTVISGLKQMQISNNQIDFNISGGQGPHFGPRVQSVGKQSTQQSNHQRQVLIQTDINQDWISAQNHYQNGLLSEVRHQSPFKKPSVTPHPVSSPSPLKGRMDPNMAQYARRQNLNITNHQQDFESTVQEMSLADMQVTKQKMEAEYARIPIILTGKSLQIRKRKEELEYELDLIEKYISRAKQNRL